MSMYYAGYTVFGLLLKESDIAFFKEQYITQNPDQFKDFETKEEKLDDLDMLLSCSESLSPCSKDEDDFYTIMIDENCDGSMFYPIFHENRLNSTYYSEDLRGEILYIIPAKIQCDPIKVWENNFYSNPHTVISDFKHKIVGKYLPEDFPYAERTGSLSYACFA